VRGAVPPSLPLEICRDPQTGVADRRYFSAHASDPELRSQVVKLTLINLLSLTLLSLFPLVLSPLFARDAQHDLDTVSAKTREVRGWFNALLSWPLFAVCFWVNAIWGPGIAKRAQGMMHPR
jgi:etoposide-induced 2.4 mRNA